MNGRRIAFASALVAILSAAPAASRAQELAMSPTARFVQSARERAASLTWYTQEAFGNIVTATSAAGRAIRQAGPRSLDLLSSVPLRLRRLSAKEPEDVAGGHEKSQDGACPPEDAVLCEPEEPCCPEFWEHRTGLFGDFLYLSAREQDLPYATPVDGTIAGATPLGPTSVLDPGYSPGFRVGGSVRLGPLSSIQGTYWYYRSTDTDFLSMPGGTGWVRSEVTHPSTSSVAADSLSANASYDIDFQMADVVYRHVIWGDRNYVVNVAVGARYAHLD
ncbi:MAG TPA: hypothetical protein EYP14_12065, partial [Planctomycetaceae bacterium]|nr:hypothetical protein [Planctomycetaceae bacterium]